jgi:retron-type reverse transcriptase
MEKRLIDLISEPATLEKAWRSVRRGSPSSSGIDDITIAEFAHNWPQEKKSIQASLRSQTYNFSPYRGQPIKKKKDASLYDLNAWRPISIPIVRDRIVQRAILNRIWKDIRSHVYIETSFGGIRPYKIMQNRRMSRTPLDSNDQRCVKSAVKRILELREQGYVCVFETDIEKFFPSIDRQRLLGFLHNLLRDNSINDLILSALDTSIANAKELGKLAELWDPTLGVPQGGILSPILANLYLYDHDKSLTDLGFKLVRYVDDLIVLTENEERAHQAYKICKQSLKILGLDIHPLNVKENNKIKTRILPPNQPFEFLGLTFSKETVRPSSSKLKKIRERIDEITDTRMRSLTLDKTIQELNWCMKGWVNAYRFCNLSKSDLTEIDNYIEQRLRGWLVRREIISKLNKIDKHAYRWLGVESATSIYISPLLVRTKVK